MLLSVLLLLLLKSTRAAYYGFTYSYTVGNEDGDRFRMVDRRLYSFSTCEEVDAEVCGSSCKDPSRIYNKMEAISGEWCLKEIIETTLNPTYTGFSRGWSVGNWTYNLNGIVESKLQYSNDVRIRLDTGKPNSSPVSAILPVVRVNSNCPRNIDLLTFDPDGDEVRCRYASSSSNECTQCTTPSVLSLSSSCTLSFSPTNSSYEGPYALQLILEDFAAQTTVMFQIHLPVFGSITAGSTFSRISSQFIVQVDPAVPSCREGQYLPRFLPPTPGNRAEINTTVGQRVDITISAEATQSVITDLVLTGPHNGTKNMTGPGNWNLSWTPSDSDEGISQPICFIVQANVSSTVYHSDLRCLIVKVANSTELITTLMPALPTTEVPTTTRTVTTTDGRTNTTSVLLTTPTAAPGPVYVIALNAKISTTLSLENERDTILRLIKEELVRQGLPPAISLRTIN